MSEEVFMNVTFADIVDEIKVLDIASKEYLVDLIKKQLIEARRREIKKKADEGMKALQAGKITFGHLKRMKTAIHED
jgi:hypothetical protein